MLKKKKLNLLDLTAVGIGCIFGSGIFAMLGIGISYAGRGIVLALLLAMALVFMEYVRAFIFSATLELDGGLYDQASLTQPPSLIGANTYGIVISSFSLSAAGVAISSYLGQLIPVLASHEKMIAFTLITVFFAFSIGGNKLMARAQIVMLICMYSALLLFVIFGIKNRNMAAASDVSFLPQGIPGLFVAAAMMSYACNGAINVANLTKDTEKPRIKVPLAMLIASVVCVVLYVIIDFAATCALPYSDIAGQNLGYIAQQVMPSGVYLFFMLGGAVMALTTTAIGSLAALKWPLLACAKDGWLPSVFKKETSNGYPWVIMLMIYLLSVIPILGGFSLENIVSMILVPRVVTFMAGNISAWNVPKQFPKAWGENTLHLSAIGYRVMMVISCIISGVLTVCTLATQSVGMIVANLVMTAFLFIFAHFRYHSGKVHLATRDIHIA